MNGTCKRGHVAVRLMGILSIWYLALRASPVAPCFVKQVNVVELSPSLLPSPIELLSGENKTKCLFLIDRINKIEY